MAHDPNLKVPSRVTLSVSLGGWTALVPAGYRPGRLLVLLSVMGLSAISMLVISLLSTGMLVFTVPIGLVSLYGILLHGLRGVRSTRLEVSGRELRIQRRMLGLNLGEPARVSLDEETPLELKGVMQLQSMKIGAHSIPVYSANEDLQRLLSLLEESKRLAVLDQATAPIPAQLQAMRGMHS